MYQVQLFKQLQFEERQQEIFNGNVSAYLRYYDFIFINPSLPASAKIP